MIGKQIQLISTSPEKYWALLSAMAARVSVVMKRLTSGHPTTCTTWRCHSQDSQESFHFSPRFIIMFSSDNFWWSLLLDNG